MAGVKAMRHLKKDVLRVLADGTPRSAGSIAVAVHFWPGRAMSSYLHRLRRYGLVYHLASRWRGGLWQITQAGTERLRWFERRPRYPWWLGRDRERQ